MININSYLEDKDASNTKNTVGPSGMTFLNSDKLGEKYDNDLFVGSYNLGLIFHFDLNSNRTELDSKDC